MPTFGLDALSSAAYGPEAALTVLLPLGAAGLTLILPLTIAIVILLGIVYFSYGQTIAAYPNGGGSYTVWRENLGANASLVAAAALMTDYLLNVAVGISAGVGALISALPALQPYTLALCLVILILLTFVNLRGISLKLENLQEPIVVVPIVDWSSIAENALRFAITMSREVEVQHIESDDDPNSLKRIWPSRVEEPAREAQRQVPQLTVLKSPFRFVVQPIIDHVLEIERKNPDRTIAVLLPELVEPRWYQYFLHNQRDRLLTTGLVRKGTHGIVIVKVPWYLPERRL